MTEQIKTPQIQCAGERDSPGAVYRADHVHKVQKDRRSCQKVQQITEASQQQYMYVDVPAEIRYQNTATHQNTMKDAQVQRQVQKIWKKPSEIHSKVQNMLMPGSSEAAVQSPGPVLQISSRRQTSLR